MFCTCFVCPVDVFHAANDHAVLFTFATAVTFETGLPILLPKAVAWTKDDNVCYTFVKV